MTAVRRASHGRARCRGCLACRRLHGRHADDGCRTGPRRPERRQHRIVLRESGAELVDAAWIALKHRHTFTWAAELLGRAYERGHTVASLERLIDQGPARTARCAQDEEPHRGPG